LLFALAGRVFDLQRMQPVTELNALPTHAGSAFDFEPDRDQIAVASDGALRLYRPTADGEHWAASDVAGTALPFGEDGFAGMVALGGGDYVIAAKDGVVARIGQDGRLKWRIAFNGVGEALDLRYSASRHYAVLIGTRGLRVFEAQTGLALSGVLHPPGWRPNPFDPSNCASGVYVADDASLRVICASSGDDVPPPSAWSPQLYRGDLRARLSELLCDADANLNGAAALARCLGR
jgi:hypothetical protein